MGIVYILTNDAMPGIIKIGQTDGTIEERMKSLDTTSVPLPFRFYFALKTKRSAKAIESLIHNAFAEYRIRSNREFFRMDPERAVAALRMAEGEEIKDRNDMIDEGGNSIEEKKYISINSRKGGFFFDSVNIPIGAELTFTRDSKKKCKVCSNRKVEYKGQEYSLSGLGRLLLKESGYNWKAVQGPLYFSYQGNILSELKNNIVSDDNEDDNENDE